MIDGPFSVEAMDLLSRWYQLRQRGLLYPLLQEWDKLYKFNPIARWDRNTMVKVSIEELRADVESAEGDTNERKAVCSETRMPTADRWGRTG